MVRRMPVEQIPHRAERFHGIDVLKAFAILSVVWIHAHDTLGPNPSIAVQITRSFSHFVVASFLFASGFLHWSATPLPARTVGRRFLRVLLPYTIASIVALTTSHWYQGSAPTWSEALYQFATGSALGFYHFVPLLIAAVLLSYFLSRSTVLTRFALVVMLIAGLLTAQGIIDVGTFWYPRHPIRWWVYYLFGWVVREHWPQMLAIDERRSRIGAVVLASLGIAFAISGSWILSTRTPRILWGALIYIGSLLWVGGLVFSVRTQRTNAALQYLSDATYPVYLYHYFFVVPVWAALGHVGSLRTTVVAYIAGWAGSLLVITVGRRSLGRWARWLIG